MLLDDIMPRHDITEIHHRVVAADAHATFAAAKALDFYRSWPTRTLMLLRRLPERILRRDTGAGPGATLTFTDMQQMGFFPLGEVADEETVWGFVQAPFPQKEQDVGPLTVEEFTAFDRPGFIRVAFDISLRPYGKRGTLASTETRVAATDPETLRRFRRYWLVVGPFSAYIRTEALRLIAREAEPR